MPLHQSLVAVFSPQSLAILLILTILVDAM
jgi:hypothetical protein